VRSSHHDDPYLIGKVTPPLNPGEIPLSKLSEAEILNIMRTLSERAPSGPVGQKGLISAKQEKHPPWSVQETNDALHIWVPENLESFGDDYLVIAAIEAIFLLQQTKTVVLITTDEDQPRKYKDTQNKVSLYFSGMACALKARHIQSNPKYSGAFGKGYNWIVFKWFEHAKVNSVFLTGGVTSPQMIASGSAWGDQLSGSTNRLIALCRRGAGALQVDGIAQWLRPFESLRGKEIKKDLKHKRVGILSKMECDYLCSRYPEVLDEYWKFAEELKTADLAFARNLPQRITKVNMASAIPESIANRVVQQRLNVLLPPQKRAREKALKKPILALIEEMEPEVYIETFNPAMVYTKEVFSCNLKHILVHNDDPIRIGQILRDQYFKYSGHIGGDKIYRDQCISWFDATVASKLGF
jgi:hypothetical protein